MDGKSSKNVIVVTGFGPFGGHPVNDSWICVKNLREMSIEDELGVTLVTQEIPVKYSECESQVPILWKTYSPTLVVHVGVHPTENIAIESVARKNAYTKQDVSGFCPPTECCTLGTEDCITTGIDLKSILSAVDSRGINLSVSHDAGRYLCEYTYYLSLCQDRAKAVFIHIPRAGTSPTIEDKTFVLKNIIVAIYRQLMNEST